MRALAIRSDQADTAAAKPLVETVVAHFGKLDILLNNVAIVAKGQTPGDPNLDAAALSDGGRIIFIGSLNGTRSLVPGVADYAGTKAAINGCTKGAARDLGPRNITVNVVQPGAMPTDMMAEVFGGTNAPDAFLDLHPIRRIATLEEVSAVVCFLAGPNAGYMTGGVIDVAGGLGI